MRKNLDTTMRDSDSIDTAADSVGKEENMIYIDYHYYKEEKWKNPYIFFNKEKAEKLEEKHHHICAYDDRTAANRALDRYYQRRKHHRKKTFFKTA